MGKMKTITLQQANKEASLPERKRTRNKKVLLESGAWLLRMTHAEREERKVRVALSHTISGVSH